MNPKSKPQKPSLTSFHQNPQTVEVCSMICETGANQLVTRCSDCKHIHDPQITRELILQNPLTPLQPYLTSPRMVSEVCVRGLYYEIAFAEKQLEQARQVLTEFPTSLLYQLNFDAILSNEEQKTIDQWYKRLKAVLEPKQSKIQPGQIPIGEITEEPPKKEHKTTPLSIEETEIIEALITCNSQVQNGVLPLKTLHEEVNQNRTISNHFLTLQQINKLANRLGFQKRTSNRTHQICIILDSEKLEQLKQRLPPNNNPKTETENSSLKTEAAFADAKA